MKNRLALPLAFLMIGGTLAGFSTAFAQPMRTLNDDAWCAREKWSSYNDGERYCEVREVTLPADRSLIAVDGRQNGGIKVEGWDRDEILVRARVQAHARTEDAAERLAEAVEIRTGRTIYADVPEGKRNEWASVSFHLFVPRASNLDLEAHNGGIHVESVEGTVDFDARNGGVSLIDLAGDVRGETTNGGLEIVLTGTAWQGAGMDVKTTNGGVEIIVPEGYSADLETRTVNGGIEVDFPITIQGRIDRRLSTTLGEGGPPIRAVTTNGGVEIRRR